MTYPGTTRRAQTSLESSLISRVTELERERDELVAKLKAIQEICSVPSPCSDTQAQFNHAAARS